MRGCREGEASGKGRLQEMGDCRKGEAAGMGGCRKGEAAGKGGCRKGGVEERGIFLGRREKDEPL